MEKSPLFSRTIHKVSNRQRKNRSWFLYQVVNPNKQISSQVRSRCLWKWPYVPLIYLDLFRRVIWIVHNISWLFTCTVQSMCVMHWEVLHCRLIVNGSMLRSFLRCVRPVWGECSLYSVSPRGGGSSLRRDTVNDHGRSRCSDAATTQRALGRYWLEDPCVWCMFRLLFGWLVVIQAEEQNYNTWDSWTLYLIAATTSTNTKTELNCIDTTGCALQPFTFPVIASMYEMHNSYKEELVVSFKVFQFFPPIYMTNERANISTFFSLFIQLSMNGIYLTAATN